MESNDLCFFAGIYKVQLEVFNFTLERLPYSAVSILVASSKLKRFGSESA